MALMEALPLTPDVLIGLAMFSLATLVVSPFLLAAVLAWMPADYFAREEPPASSFAGRHPALRMSARLLKNALGALLLGAGIVMLFTPGQGSLTIFAGLLLLDFPGKRALELRIIRIPTIARAVNRLRVRAHRPPLTETVSANSRSEGRESPNVGS